MSFKEHILILGWNQNIEKIISSILNLAKDDNFNLVLVNDGSEEDYDEIKSKFPMINIKVIHGDFTKENVLKRANAEYGSIFIILSDSYGNKSLDEADEKTLLAVLAIKAISPEAKIFAEVLKDEKAKFITRAGADTIVMNGEFNPVMISGAIVSPAMPIFIKQLIADYNNPKVKLEPVPKNYIGKTFGELFSFIRNKTKGMPVGILATQKELTIDDLLSTNNSIDIFIRKKFEEAEDNYFEQSKEGQEVKINPDDSYIITENDTFVFVVG